MEPEWNADRAVDRMRVGPACIPGVCPVVEAVGVIEVDCSPARLYAVAAEIVDDPHAMAVSHVTGPCDLLVTAVFTNNAALSRYIGRRLGELDGVVAVRPQVATRLHIAGRGEQHGTRSGVRAHVVTLWGSVPIDGAAAAVAAQLNSLCEVHACVSLTGRHNLMFTVWLRGLDEIGPLEARLRTCVPGLILAGRAITLWPLKAGGHVLADPRRARPLAWGM
jgi:hypothetical protein